MRFLQKNKIEKTILVVSDIHLGAGTYVHGKKNLLEDFHYDKELVEFLEYFSTGEYQNRHVELIINGDLFDFLAVPYVRYFDDEFWSEEAALDKLKMMIEAHREVIDALVRFIDHKSKSLTYILGNHDAELTLDAPLNYLKSLFKNNIERFQVLNPRHGGEYIAHEGVVLKHGHEYEIAHSFDPQSSVVKDLDGRSYFIPPWGSYYVTRVVNKFKEKRDYINAVRPIKRAMINGLIYDTLFTVRFLLANAFYFIMVRFISIYKQGKNLRDVFLESLQELELFKDFEELTEEYFNKNKKVKCLIVGHTHEPIFRIFNNGNCFINTGTWTDMYYMNWKNKSGLTFAHVDIISKPDKDDEVRPSLHYWKGNNNLPYKDFS